MSTFRKYKKSNSNKHHRRCLQKKVISEDSSYVTKGRLTVDSLYGIFAKSASSETAIRECRSRKREREKAEKTLQKITSIHDYSGTSSACLRISPVTSILSRNPMKNADTDEHDKENNSENLDGNVFRKSPIVAEMRESSSQTSFHEKSSNPPNAKAEQKNASSTAERNVSSTAERNASSTAEKNKNSPTRALQVKRFVESINRGLKDAALNFGKDLDTFSETKKALFDCFYVSRPLTTPPSSGIRISSNLQKMNSSLDSNGVWKLQLKQVSTSSSSPGYTLNVSDCPKSTIMKADEFLIKCDNLALTNFKRRRSENQHRPDLEMLPSGIVKRSQNIKREKDVIVNPLQYLRSYETSSLSLFSSTKEPEATRSVFAREEANPAFNSNVCTNFDERNEQTSFPTNVSNYHRNQMTCDGFRGATIRKESFEPFSQNLALREPNSMQELSRKSLPFYPHHINNKPSSVDQTWSNLYHIDPKVSGNFSNLNMYQVPASIQPPVNFSAQKRLEEQYNIYSRAGHSFTNRPPLMQPISRSIEIH